MPDALSKTVPVWCCVINLALFPDISTTPLFTPPGVVSASEHSQILALIPSFLASLRSLNLDLEPLRKKISKPLRPFWITQESQLIDMPVVFEDFHPVVCCTSSRRVLGGEMSEGGYIQGAGDDTENWALGLTPEVFWEHADKLLGTPESSLPELLEGLVEQHRLRTPLAMQAKEVGRHVFVCSLPLAEPDDPMGRCRVVLTEEISKPESWVKAPNLMEVGLGKYKVASRNLRTALPDICSFISAFLASLQDQDPAVYIGCKTGKDLAIGAALAALCWCFDANGKYRPTDGDVSFDKEAIRVKLGGIMSAYPEANPSRATLQSVHRFLMDYRR
jgi:tRNA A64-2'-O-ribosylphosphate transferase